MKIKVSFEMEVGEYKKSELGYLYQDVFDNLTNYANCGHLEDALTWLANKKETYKGQNKEMMKYHSDWAKYIDGIKQFKIEKV